MSAAEFHQTHFVFGFAADVGYQALRQFTVTEFGDVFQLHTPNRIINSNLSPSQGETERVESFSRFSKESSLICPGNIFEKF
jgi:hypothetical protein